jgi:N-6 DNA Methylase
MNALRILREQIAKIGYAAIEKDYVFPDVFVASGENRTAQLAAFTHTPPSYRNAAIAVVTSERRQPIDIVTEFRALGAPLLFVIEDTDVTVWEVRSEKSVLPIARVRQDQIANLFASNRTLWSPQSIQRAKSIGNFDRKYQLDFVDLGLLPAIEGEIHAKLDYLLNEALAKAINPQTGRTRHVTEYALFSAVFRFLAAKILQDRSHVLARSWDSNRIQTVLAAIAKYYQLPPLLIQEGTQEYRIFEAVWQHILGGINFQNISSDDLAFVYENTLVTPDVRKRFGTHSTPRQVAEYVVRNLRLHEHDPEQLRIYEPFAGAAVLLVSALRHLRELLPVAWNDERRHNFLIEHLAGDEVDAFACEVAMLSLVLADYPNHNGWHIRNANLFEDGVLQARMCESNVILCNPPFEAFAKRDRTRYSIAADAPSKAVAVLNAALDAKPLALGFVLPRNFILGRQFSAQRKRIETLYETVELAELPDRTFRVSEVESSLLIAREPRQPLSGITRLRSTHVSDRDRAKFIRTGEVTTSRECIRTIVNEPSGNLWIPPLESLWQYVAGYPKLGTKLRPSWGLQWTYDQSKSFSDQPRAGFRKGLQNAKGLRQFIAQRPVWLDYRKDCIRRGYGQDWQKPKLIMNEARLSRGPWRIGAALDTRGLLYSQQFFGLWPTAALTERELLAFAAIINSPLANAFIAIHSPGKGIRSSSVKEIPIPCSLPDDIADLVLEYSARLSKPQMFDDGPLNELLSRIDAAVLRAYDLPPRIERELLEYFRGAERPVAHQWAHWFPEQFRPFIPLHEYLSDEYKTAARPWIQEVFEPLPPDEAVTLREFMD